MDTQVQRSKGVDLVSDRELMVYEIPSHGAKIYHRRLSYLEHAEIEERHTVRGRLNLAPYNMEIMEKAVRRWEGFFKEGIEIPYDPKMLADLPSFIVVGTNIRGGLVSHILSANPLIRTEDGLREDLLGNLFAPLNGASDSPTDTTDTSTPADSAETVTV